MNVSEDAWFNFAGFPSPRHLAPRSSRFVTLFGADDNPVSPLTDQIIDLSTQKAFERQKEVRISLTAVMFDDGGAAGPDTSGWVSRWRAYLNAERDVLSAAAAADSGEMMAVMAEDVHSGSEVAKPLIGHVGIDDLSHGDMFEAFRLASSYDEQYQCYAGATAKRVISRVGDTNDEVLTAQEFRNLLSKKRYPTVRRVERYRNE